MQSINTKYLSPTNTQGARIKATTASGISATVSYNHEFEGAAVHFEAVKALCKKLGWSGEMVAGSTKDGYNFTFIDQRTQKFSI